MGALIARSSAADGNADVAKKLGFDRFWIEALDAISRCYSPGDSLLAPNEFLHFFDNVYPLHIRRAMIPSEGIDWFLLHKGMRKWVDPALLEEALGLSAHFANEVFVLFGRQARELPDDQKSHLHSVLEWKETLSVVADVDGHAALVTTFDRPTFLERCLESIVRQFDRILIVDDGSKAMTPQYNAASASRAGVEYVHLDRNRGHACALNVGIAMLLADLDIGWISKFDDDTEFVSGGLQRLKSITRAFDTADRRNFYSGYLSPNHRVQREEMISSERVMICRSCSGQHMHAHRSYWEAILPIPTTYQQAPKSGGGIFAGQGSDIDWWCSNWAPGSAVKKGGSVYVLPGLVKHLGGGHSTWSTNGT